MALYIGFFRPNQAGVDFISQKVLEGEWTNPPVGQGSADSRLTEKVRGFPAFLELQGVKLLGSYAAVGLPPTEPTNPPGVTMIETDNEAALAAINNYYAPYVVFSFHRYNQVQRPN